MLRLDILEWVYVPVGKPWQGQYKQNRKISRLPMVQVQLYDIASGKAKELNLYDFLRKQVERVGERVSYRTTEQLLQLYKRMAPFDAESWAEWPLLSLEDLRQVLA